MKLVRYPDPVLNQRSVEVVESDLEAIKNVIAPMTKIMNEHNGIGLAAVQVGILKRFSLLNLKADPYFTKYELPEVVLLIKPEVLEKKDPVRMQEGCLSLPLYSEFQERFATIVVKYRDENWAEHTREFTGLAAQCILHEIEHMDGSLLINKDSPMKVQMYRKKLKKRGAL